MAKTRRGMRKKVDEKNSNTIKPSVEEKKLLKEKENEELKAKVVEKLSLLSKKNALSIGFRSILRSLKKDSFGLVVVSEDLEGVLSKTAKMFCIHNDVPLLSVKANQLKTLKPKISRISAVGVKRELIDADEDLKSLVKEMKGKKAKRKISDDSEEIEKVKLAYIKCMKMEVTEVVSTKPAEDVNSTSQEFNAENFPYCKKTLKTDSEILKMGTFIPLSKTTSFYHDGFPNYDMSHHLNKIIIKVEDKEGVADLSKLLEL